MNTAALNALRALAEELLDLSGDATHAAADGFILLEVKDNDGKREIWPGSLSWVSEHENGVESSGLSRLLIAPSGAGKTTLLKEIALCQARGDERQLAFYLHLGWLRGNTPQDYLVTKCQQRGNPDAAALLRDLEENGQLIYLLDGFDQVDSVNLAQTISGWARNCAKIVASRPMPDAVLGFWQARGWKVWKLVPVGPTRAKKYLDNRDKELIYSRLIKERGTRELLRLPLYLKMLRDAEFRRNDPTDGAAIFDRYWEWRTAQEDQTRTEAGNGVIDGWTRVRESARACAWRLAVAGHIQEFRTAGLPADTTRAVQDLAETLRTHRLRRFDIVAVDGDGGKFGHQAFQAYLAAEAIAEDIVNGGSGSVLSVVLEELQRGFPERLELDSPPARDLSFWMEAFDLLPGVLAYVEPRTDVQDSKLSRLLRSLAERGLFLLGWRIAKAALDRRGGGDPGLWEGWPPVLWQLVRYRRDAEQHFPVQAPGWAYDPLPLATGALDAMSSDALKSLRQGLGHALENLPGPRTQKLGIYELVDAYMGWDGAPETLDEHRIAFRLGQRDSCTRLQKLVNQFRMGMDVAAVRTRSAESAWVSKGSRLPVPDDAEFGSWLETKAVEQSRAKEVWQELEEFKESFFAPDAAPTSEAFCRWIGACYLDDLLSNGMQIPLDVSLRMFNPDWIRGIGESIERNGRVYLTKEAARRRLGGNLEEQVAAAVVLGPLVASLLKNDLKQEMGEFGDQTYRLFETAVKEGDVELAYTGYHEAARFVTDPKKVHTMQDHIKRYYAQEVRWHDEYWEGGPSQLDFTWERMVGERPYPNKAWFYCFDAPLLLELGTSPGGRNVDTLLSGYMPYATEEHEKSALEWARNSIECMKEL